MAEAIHTEINWEPTPDGMNEQDLASETAQQMVELKRLHLSSRPIDLSSSYLQEQQDVKDEVTKDMEEMIQDCGDGLLLPDCCIYKVPLTLRHHKAEFYTPKFVSIGPFHYDNESLQDMQKHKKIFFKRFTQRAESSLDDLVHCVKHLEPKVRASYSETIHLSEQELVKLTLIDAGFIIQLFIMLKHDHHQFCNDDAKFSQPWLQVYIQKDLILLENQLPFFVIEELYDKAFPPDRRGSFPSFLRLTYEFFDYYNEQKLEPNVDVKIKHFTDLIRLFYLPISKPQQHLLSEFGSHKTLYSAKALQEAGIKLKASKNKCLLDLKFSGDTLEIPTLLVADRTEFFFRNMIALEQCHYPYAAYISDYAHVLDCLIDTCKDVDVLVHNKVVSNCLGDPNSVALLANGLLTNFIRVTFNSQYYDICQRLNGYCEDPRHKMMATLRRDYCNTPWHTAASIAGIILLVLTIVQTIFSILQVLLEKQT
ncbi:UPF0481 protein At3g47200-like [Neltuma alba]|uniref:UPF0481 protein At3g47200-like n=1 Tax=Neltuma alba TaxID=207710 RepID=UPI0010A312CC|nr:UPF0481 protein At3g47200-like [Prosopis alba]